MQGKHLTQVTATIESSTLWQQMQLYAHLQQLYYLCKPLWWF